MSRQIRFSIASIVLAAAVLMTAAPAEAQREWQPLFDKFNFKAEFSFVGISTSIRLDSEALGEGTTLNFEDDLDLGNRESIPTLAFEWQIAKRHRLGVRWQDITRASNAQALTEIQWGDETIPIDADITLGFDITQTFVDYTYYPWVKDKWAAGFGLGLRVMDVSATLEWQEETVGEGNQNASGTGPLPYLYFDYRRLFGEKWRFSAGLGWLYISIDDISGGQWIGRLGIEYLVGKRWSFGAAVNFAHIDVDWEGIKNDDGEGLLAMALDMDINDFSVFARVRF